MKREERELLEAQSIPLRNYLMTHVMPTLMQGLNECCKVRPDDPVDFLAEYLFKNNPETQWKFKDWVWYTFRVRDEVKIVIWNSAWKKMLFQFLENSLFSL